LNATPEPLPNEILELRQRFAEKLDAKVDALSRRWAAGERSLENIPCVQDLERMAHNLAGSGTTFGYPAVSEAARALEHIFCRALAGESCADAGLTDHIEELLNRLRRGCGESAEPLEDGGSRRAKRTESDQRLIFVVDDDPSQAELLAEGIRHFGYVVRIFPSPSDMNAELRKARPHLILIDIVFPQGSSHGIDRVAALGDAEDCDIPVIFTSTRNDFEARLGAVRAGARDYFVKPVDTIRLIERIDELTSQEEAEPYRVLVVEDDQILAEVYALALTDAGMRVEIASDACEVMNRLERVDVELILMDLYLPKCSGLELAKIIRQQDAYASVPIVFLSTEARLDRQLLAMSLGGDDFLTKPISLNHLVAAVSSRVQRARVMRSFMIRDSMTRAFNHATTLDHLRSEVSRASRNDTQFSFCIIDLDHFKSVNDTYGHPAGDRVIKSLARLLQQRLRRTDVVGRYGGEEFAVILPDTQPERAHALIESLRNRFATFRQGGDGSEFRVTFSAGIAAYPRYPNADELIEAADTALYQAKEQGRDCVVLLADCESVAASHGDKE
jgi:diguanylate cyclase (GGDEF)-like protein